MSSIIAEARKAVHASRSKIALTEVYAQNLRAQYEDINVKHEATTAKLKEDCHTLNQQLAIARESIEAREWDVQRMIKGHKLALKNAEDYAEIAEKKLLNLKKEKSQEHRGVAAARVLGGIAKNEKLNQIQDYRDSLISSREQGS